MRKNILLVAVELVFEYLFMQGLHILVPPPFMKIPFGRSAVRNSLLAVSLVAHNLATTFSNERWFFH